MIKNKKKNEHYVDNKKFLEAMTEFKERCDKAKKRGRKTPPVTNYIGECFLKIANHLSYRPNFINYTFRDDMISDGIENCLQYLSNFDPKKSKNPFAYFTQIIYYAFVRRIQKEKKQNYVKYKYLNHLDTKGDFSELLKQFDFHEEEKEYFRKLHEKEVNKKKKLRKRRKKNV